MSTKDFSLPATPLLPSFEEYNASFVVCSCCGVSIQPYEKCPCDVGLCGQPTCRQINIPGTEGD